LTAPPAVQFRRELKMVGEAEDLPAIRAWIRLHPAGFVPLHPPRRVNNAYFDTPELRSLEESRAGIAVKHKIRVRWYGSSDSGVQAVFQIKSRFGQAGAKSEQRLPAPLDLMRARWSDVIATVRAGLGLEMRQLFERQGVPLFINRYDREYHVTGDRRVRLTLDSQQAVFDQRHSSLVNTHLPAAAIRTVIVELKAGLDEERLAEISSRLPLRIQAASKYVMAAERLLAR
jgi:hypothetical protein